MSAPNTNIEKQEKEHKGPLGGMALVIGFVVLLIIAFSIWLFAGGNEPGNDATAAQEEQLDSTAGAAVTGGEVETNAGSVEAGAGTGTGGEVENLDAELAPATSTEETVTPAE
ncbi:hypothetical protein [Profundibacterium mesophilum]|uniref:Uncharacterized protein n=1 Tax=Profundibacterium mesophilum KAUST100406-0324 TaxID=1037889 RepID=A0A921NUF6_9RHOB|nr:hypothetical protein [Profundibacterium mesophilum]KAF0674979.1 hypothetical protein PMES_02688 [Profundibacterium mesophilum KAUST100406-0324]